MFIIIYFYFYRWSHFAEKAMLSYNIYQILTFKGNIGIILSTKRNMISKELSHKQRGKHRKNVLLNSTARGMKKSNRKTHLRNKITGGTRRVMPEPNFLLTKQM